jgi:hypothetical protein
MTSSIDTLLLLPCFSRTFDIWLLLMTVIIISIYLTSSYIAWMGKKMQVNKRLKRFHISTLRIRLSQTFRNLQFTLESFMDNTLSRKNNDSSSPRQSHKSSHRTYTHKHTVIQKHNSVPYLLIAWTLLKKSPMYNPSNSNIHLPSTAPNLNYINLDNFCNIDPDPPPLSTSLSPITAMPANSKDIKTFTFDTDSFKIGIDTHATACMSPEISDFDQLSLIPFPENSGGI